MDELQVGELVILKYGGGQLNDFKVSRMPKFGVEPEIKYLGIVTETNDNDFTVEVKNDGVEYDYCFDQKNNSLLSLSWCSRDEINLFEVY
jgi:hypothetical protein